MRTWLVLLVLASFSVLIYLLGILFSSKRNRKTKEKFELFTGGLKVDSKPVKYFSSLYRIVLIFLVFDALVLLIASGNFINQHFLVFLAILFFISLMIISRIGEKV